MKLVRALCLLAMLPTVELEHVESLKQARVQEDEWVRLDYFLRFHCVG